MTVLSSDDFLESIQIVSFTTIRSDVLSIETTTENLNSQDATWEFKAVNQVIHFYYSPILNTYIFYRPLPSKYVNIRRKKC